MCVCVCVCVGEKVYKVPSVSDVDLTLYTVPRCWDPLPVHRVLCSQGNQNTCSSMSVHHYITSSLFLIDAHFPP